MKNINFNNGLIIEWGNGTFTAWPDKYNFKARDFKTINGAKRFINRKNNK
jgi:hypothetical protein